MARTNSEQFPSGKRENFGCPQFRGVSDNTDHVRVSPRCFLERAKWAYAVPLDRMPDLDQLDSDIAGHRVQIDLYMQVDRDAYIRGKPSQSPEMITLRETLERFKTTLQHLEELRAKRP